MTPIFRSFALSVLLVGLTATVAAMAAEAKSEKSAGEKGSTAAAQKPVVRVTISKETTYITEPLRPDGYPDYVAALNQRASKGVTPENNAAVLFWKAMGPSKIDEKDRKKCFAMLGIEPLPEKGDYFIDYDDFLKKKQGDNPSSVIPPSDGCDPLQDQYNTAQERPWSKEEFPEVYQWLAANEKPLATLTEASKRPRFYNPAVSNTWLVTDALPLALISQSRSGTRALRARAMLRIHDGKADEAWEDLLTCHRLGRLFGQGMTVVEALVSIAIDGMMACEGDHQLLEHARLTAVQIAKMRQELERLPPLPKMADKIDLGERFYSIESIIKIARYGLASLNDMESRKKPNGVLDSLMCSIDAATIDGDIILRISNSWCDRLGDAFRKPTRAERKAAMDKISEDIKKIETLAKDWKSSAILTLSNPREARSRQMGQMFSVLWMPGLLQTVNAEDRGAMSFELDKLAFALAAYRVDHGSYPAKLEDLKPKYVAEVPKDIFANDGPLHYEVKDGGYLLYSVGINGRDDGGKRVEDRSEENPEDWDDLVVRMKGK